MDKHHSFMWYQDNSKSQLYTALSRGKKRCFLFYEKEILLKVLNKKIDTDCNSIFMKEFCSFEIH